MRVEDGPIHKCLLDRQHYLCIPTSAPFFKDMNIQYISAKIAVLQNKKYFMNLAFVIFKVIAV